MHLEVMSGSDGWILLRKLVLLEHLAVLINFARNAKTTSIVVVIVLFRPHAFPIHDYFSAKHVFCVKFLGQNYVLAHVSMLFARLICMPDQKDNNCLHFL